MRSLHQVLSESASRAPDAVAIEHGDSRITYAELDERSSRFAGALYDLGVRRGDRVGLLLGKCVDAYAAIFAVLKAGAVLVPLDIRFPPRRVEEISKSCGMTVCITDQARVGFFEAEDCVLVVVDGTDEISTDPARGKLFALKALLSSRGCPVGPGDGDDLAYILFTSGSTGIPKGVAISHRAASWFVKWAVDSFRVDADDRILHVAPFIFDLSVFDVYATMRAGGTIVPLPDGHAIFPLRIGETIADKQITTVYLTPSQLRLLLTRGGLDQRDVSALRRVLVAGEVLDAGLAVDFCRNLPGVALYNLYGPTETNVCTSYHVTPERMSTLGEVPIGRACDGCEILLLDDTDTPVEDQMVGEILASSPGLMTGYWHDDEASHRVPERMPGAAGDQKVFYRTGDLALRNTDGELLFRGRKDRQIKHRGYRIELDEIELALLSHPEVEEALAVLVPTAGTGGTESSLVAYVRLRTPRGTSVQELLRTCSIILPAYMIPAEIRLCDELPLSLTGKRVRILSRDDGGPAC